MWKRTVLQMLEVSLERTLLRRRTRPFPVQKLVFLSHHRLDLRAPSARGRARFLVNVLGTRWRREEPA